MYLIHLWYIDTIRQSYNRNLLTDGYNVSTTTKKSRWECSLIDLVSTS